jgi:ABC-2 type transport system permease protein
MSVLFTSIFGAMSIVWDREFGFLREMLVAPVRRGAIMVGKCAGGATVATLQGIIMLVLAGLVHVPYSPIMLIELVGLMVLTATMLTAFGLFVPGRHAALRAAGVLPVRGGVPDRQAPDLARDADSLRPARLRGRPDAPRGL